MKKLFLLAAVLSSVLALTACGGGGGGQVLQSVPDDVVLDVTPATGITTLTSVQSENFVFPAGVPALGTTNSTTVVFTPRQTSTQPGDPAPAGNPGFRIQDTTGATATGLVEFGSCIFVVTASTFPTGHRLAVGARVLVQPCSVQLDTSSKPADSVSREASANLLLGQAASNDTSVTLNVNPGGQLTVNAVSIGTVTLVAATGT